MDFRVRLAETLMPAFADHPAVAHDDGAHQRIRLDVPATALGQL